MVGELSSVLSVVFSRKSVRNYPTFEVNRNTIAKTEHKENSEL